MGSIVDISVQAIYFLLAGGLTLICLVLYFLFKLLRSEKKLREANAKFQQLEGTVNSLHLKSLESKLNPHLFKNILNSIQSHAYQTYFALDKLANVLDYILYESRNKFVTPKEEIEFAQNLIEINKIKISPLFELNVKSKIDDSDILYNQKIIAPLISIDLIENAFKHADLQSPDSFIAIVFEFRESTFGITVSNKISAKPPMHKENAGFGAESLEQRLKILYRDRFKLERFVQEDVFIAYLKIDLIEQKAKMHIGG